MHVFALAKGGALIRERALIRSNTVIKNMKNYWKD
jgi:hypothetical protein